MKLEACLLLVLNAMSFCMRRGPHHPHGQTPVEQKHHHYKPRDSEALTRDAQLLHDVKHIEEDLGVITPEELSKMTKEELEFHYFFAHDYDKNLMLDGLELLKAVYHTIEHEDDDPEADSSIEPEANDLDGYITYKGPNCWARATRIEGKLTYYTTLVRALVDQTLKLDDADGDGYVSYSEYRAARDKNPLERTPRVLASFKS